MKDSINIEFLGDLSLDGLYNDPQNFLGLEENMKWINQLNSKVDYRVVNWESQLWGDGSINELKFPRLCTTKDAAQSVVPLKIDLALLANNHAYDNHTSGFRNTLDFFKQNKINHIGATEKEEEKDKCFIFTKNNIKIAILNYVGMETNPKLPDNCPVFVNILNERVVLEKIKQVKKEVDHVVVTLHWGEEESSRMPNLQQRNLGRQFIDGGASMVIGHHVHCLQGFEEYNDGLICYSLGNFLFGPQLVIPGQIHSNRTSGNNMVALLNVDFTKVGFNFSWQYLMKKKNNLFLELDNGIVEKLHKKINKYVYYSDAKLKIAYKLELIKIPIRNFIDKNGGFIKALMSIKMKQISLLKKILMKL